MKITIRYFASIRELIGTGQETLETQAQSLADLRLEISARGDAFAQAQTRLFEWR
jgi:sulfur-carrier protein